MPQSFFGDAITITNDQRTLIYTSDLPDTTSVLHSIYMANTHTTIDIWVDIELEKASAPGTYYYIGRYTPIPRGGTLVFDKPVNMMPGDKIYITSSTATGACDAVISTLKITPNV